MRPALAIPDDIARLRLLALRKRREAAGRPRKLAAYYDDPAAFLHDCFEWPEGEGPTDYQERIASNLVRYHRESFRGPRGLGKTTVDAQLLLWHALTRDDAGVDWKHTTTAGSWSQLKHYLWPEVHKWARRLRWERLGRPPLREGVELLDMSLRLKHGEAFAAASNRAELLEGAHADSLFYTFDESKSISESTFDACEGAFSGNAPDTGREAFALASSSPGAPVGRFSDIHHRKPGLEDWHADYVSLEECIRAGRVSRTWVEQRAKLWGEESALYQHNVLGEFAADASDSVVPLAWVEAAIERWQTWDEAGRPTTRFYGAGCDIGGGGDKTVLAMRYDLDEQDGPGGGATWARRRIIRELRTSGKADTMATTGDIAGVLRANPGGKAVVDSIGIGSGVVYRLKELNLPAEGFNASERSTKRDASGELGFVNLRAAAWWTLREQLDPANSSDVALPPDDELIGDLTAPTWRVMSGGNVQIESKDDIKKRLGRSTDKGDAVVMILADVKRGGFNIW